MSLWKHCILFTSVRHLYSLLIHTSLSSLLILNLFHFSFQLLIASFIAQLKKVCTSWAYKWTTSFVQRDAGILFCSCLCGLYMSQTFSIPLKNTAQNMWINISSNKDAPHSPLVVTQCGSSDIHASYFLACWETCSTSKNRMTQFSLNYFSARALNIKCSAWHGEQCDMQYQKIYLHCYWNQITPSRRTQMVIWLTFDNKPCTFPLFDCILVGWVHIAYPINFIYQQSWTESFGNIIQLLLPCIFYQCMKKSHPTHAQLFRCHQSGKDAKNMTCCRPFL